MADPHDVADAEATFRLGRITVSGFDPQAIEIERKQRRGNALFGFDSTSNQILSVNNWSAFLSPHPTTGSWLTAANTENSTLRQRRNAGLAEELRAYSCDAPIYADMRDAVFQTTSAIPVFQYNRRKGSENAVLWPLTRVHGVGSENFFGSLAGDMIPFKDKKARIFWRGNLSGFSRFGKEPENVRDIIERFLRGEINEEELEAHLNTVPRYAFVSRFAGNDKVDAGFVLSGKQRSFSNVRLIARYVKPSVSREEYLRHRYLMALSGTDVATVFGWAPATNALTLKEDCDFEVFFDCHFEPGGHFLQVRGDFDDLLNKYDWAESNLEACEEIIEGAKVKAVLLGQPEYRSLADKLLLRKYSAAVSRRERAWEPIPASSR